MNHDEFDNYLALVSRLLRLSQTQSDAMGDELRDHLETRIGEMVESGVEEKSAKLQALEEFGDAASLAQQFQSVLKSYRKRWMMRFTTFAIAGSFLVILLTFSLWPEGARFGTPNNSVAQQNDDPATEKPNTDDRRSPTTTRQSTSTELNAITIDLLEREFSCNYDETHFASVMKDLADEFDINIYLDQSARDDALPYDEPISFRITKVRLRKALDLMLREKNATFVVEDGILVFISKDVANDPEYFEREIIDARSLFKQIQIAEKAQHKTRQSPGIQIVLGTTQNSGFDGGGGGRFGRGGVFQVDSKPQDSGNTETTVNNAIEELRKSNGEEKQIVLKGPFSVVNQQQQTPESRLLELIQATVNADDWNSTNGQSTISIIGGQIVIHSSRSTIQQVQDLVRDLEHSLVN